jgi:hypothetical protein
MMSKSVDRLHLPRRRPDSIPALFPFPEYLVDDDRKDDYFDTKAVLQVPWMGVVTMALSHYRRFYRALWTGVRPTFQSAEFVEGASRVRASAEKLAATLGSNRLLEPLEAAGYAPREIDQIRELISVFHVGNVPYALLATMARTLLEGREIAPKDTLFSPFQGRHAPDVKVPFVLMEAHHADAPTRALYEDIKEQLRLPFVNTDYRALARWPTYFTSAWHVLRPHVRTPDYELAVTAIHDLLVELSTKLPNPNGLTSAALRQAAIDDGAPDDICRTVELFQWLLPGLVLNVACFRAQLAG